MLGSLLLEQVDLDPVSGRGLLVVIKYCSAYAKWQDVGEHKEGGARGISIRIRGGARGYVVRISLSFCGVGVLVGMAFVFSAFASRRRCGQPRRSVVMSSSDGEAGVTVVLGATGRTGRLVVKQLLESDTKDSIRAVVRDSARAKEMLGADSRLELVVADVRNKDESLRGALKGADTLISCVGSTAVPTETWRGGANSPMAVLGQGIANVVDCLEPGTLSKFVLLSAIGTQNSSFMYKIFDFFGKAWTASLEAEMAVIAGAEEKGYKYCIVHSPGLKAEGTAPKPVALKSGDIGKPLGTLRRENAAEACIQCATRDIETSYEISPYNTKGSDPTNWDLQFSLITDSAKVLQFEFNSINKDKFKSWLIDFGSSLPTNAALFPPLPLPVRVDPNENGVRLGFISVSAGGEVKEVGALDIALEGERLIARREPAGLDTPIPGEKQVLKLLVESLDKVTN